MKNTSRVITVRNKIPDISCTQRHRIVHGLLESKSKRWQSSVITNDRDNSWPDIDNRCEHQAYNQLCNCNPNKSLRISTRGGNQRTSERWRQLYLRQLGYVGMQRAQSREGEDHANQWTPREDNSGVQRMWMIAALYILDVHIGSARMVVKSTDRTIIFGIKNKTWISIFFIDLLIIILAVTLIKGTHGVLHRHWRCF